MRAPSGDRHVGRFDVGLFEKKEVVFLLSWFLARRAASESLGGSGGQHLELMVQVRGRIKPVVTTKLMEREGSVYVLDTTWD